MEDRVQTEEMNCCICKHPFTQSSNPRMMPSCSHSACTLCIKQCISKAKNQPLVCQHCGSHQKPENADIQCFPKNVSLGKLLKQKYSTSPQNASHNNQSSRDTVSSINQAERQFCQIHKKNLQIICLNDRVKLCAHCAIFGTHKDHQFKTIDILNTEMNERFSLFENYKNKKSVLDCKLKSNEFKDSIVKKIGQQKDRLICDIKKKFSKIFDNIKLAEKKAYEDVVKNFKLIYSKISALIKQENQSQKKYKLWELKCTQLFDKASKMKRIEDKVALYYDGPLQICKQGETLLSRLQTKINSNIQSIESLISQIKILENTGISNSVFNYINVVFQDSDNFDLLGSVHQQVLYPKEQSRTEKIQFGGDHLSSDRLSLSPVIKKKSVQTKQTLSKVSSDKKLSTRSVPVSERTSVDFLIEQFCQRDNLDTLDLTGYSLNDSEVYEILAYIKPIKKVKGLKLVKNKLTNQGLQKIVELISSVTNLNLSFNQLGDESMITLLDNRPRIPYLRIINLSNNKINERRTKNAIDELKKQGLIVTI